MNITEAKRMLREELDKHELYHVEARMNNRLTSAFGRYRYNRDSSIQQHCYAMAGIQVNT